MTNIFKFITPDRKVLFIILFGVATLVLIRYAEIIKDGDLWFHIAYGKYMLAHHTLIPDHTLYSWSPTVQDKIYCAWTAEILLYVMYTLGEIPVFFVFRYLCILVFLVLALLSMKRNQVLLNPLAWLMLLTSVYMCRSAMDIKPEILSFVFMAFSAWSWLKARSSETSCWYFYLLPTTMLVWVNTHGGFIFGMIFISLATCGEILNYLFSPRERIGRKAMKHFLLAVLICFAVLLITPYGPAYPLQLFNDLVLNNKEQLKEFRTVGAYHSIFHDAAAPLHFIDYLIISTAVLILLFSPYYARRRFNWALLLPNIGIAVLYMQFIRTTYFFGVLCCFTTFELLKPGTEQSWLENRRIRASIAVLSLVLCMFISFRETYESVCRPSFGFGINYYSPVEETGYIRDHLLLYRLGNDYNCGTYLLWKLWPEAKVFMDARYFPYREWYREYAEFVYGSNISYKDDFIKRYGCETWCSTYDFPQLSYFINSQGWRLVHYGPSACIFALRELPVPIRKASFSRSISSIPTDQCLKIMNFAVSVGDIENAVFIAKNLDRNFCTRNMKRQISLSCIRLGDALIKRSSKDEAIYFFELALSMNPSREPAVYNTLGTLYLYKSDFETALVNFSKALNIKPDYLPALNNMALTYSRKGEYGRALGYLDDLLKLSPEKPDNYYNIACIYARWNKPDEALKWLALAVKKGFSNRELMESDSDLAPLRDMEGFREILPRE